MRSYGIHRTSEFAANGLCSGVPAALFGAIFYLLAGLQHVSNGQENKKEDWRISVPH
jgi:hypothetical protein